MRLPPRRDIPVYVPRRGLVDVFQGRHNERMRARTRLGVLLACLVLAACSGSANRDLARYYDPEGLFSADLPAANTLSVTPPQTGQRTASILSGVVAAPPQPSASPSSALGDPLGGGIGQQAPAGDQTMYEVFVVTTNTLDSLDAMTLYFLTADPAIDVRDEQPVEVANAEGRLVVADIRRSGAVVASVAAALTLGSHGVGYIVAAVFPPGGWSNERSDFARVVASLRPSVPPALASFPLTSG
jgi:hypothetical protein